MKRAEKARRTKPATKVIPIAQKPEVTIVQTEDPSTVILNLDLDVGAFVGSRNRGASFEVSPAMLPEIADAFIAAVRPQASQKVPGWATYTATADIGSRLHLDIEVTSPLEDDPRCDVVLMRHCGGQLLTERLEGLNASDLDPLAANLVAAIKVARHFKIIPPPEQ
jgi:hypothetical protein